MVAMMAGADFIKTSTGKEAVNATLPVGVVMTRMIRDYRDATGAAVGFKPAGGIRTAKSALDWLILMKEELDDRWLRPDLFRVGASALLTDIERQLEHFVTGRYSAAYRHPLV
jgi:deoxyribose-phosphate aldolase